MGDGAADLSGSGPQQVWVHVHRVSSNQGGNYSTYYGELRYYGNGAGSWINEAGSWRMTGPGLDTGWGSFNIPYGNRFDTYTVLWSGYWNLWHDGNGNISDFWVAGTIDYNIHSSIGSGTADAYEPAAPRIPKPAAAPTVSGTVGGTVLGLDEIDTDSMRFRFSGNDLGGGALVRWEAWFGKTNPPTSMVPSSGTTTVETLDPGTEYFWRARAITRGIDGSEIAGNYSATISASTLAGVFVSNGSAWVAQPLRVSSGSAWLSLVPLISDGDSWEQPLDV